MSMTRHKIAVAKSIAQEFIERCDDATAQLDKEARGYDRERSGYDASYGSKRTGTLRRRSMDLTRILAELRK